jgi:hypothetical protein
MGKVRTMHEAWIKTEKNKESAWGKKEDEGRRDYVLSQFWKK